MATRRLLALLLTTSLGAALGGCYSGFDVEDKEPPPGYPGGVCYNDACQPGATCHEDEQVCVDLVDPCKGFYCGGAGLCTVDLDTFLPVCTCDAGYSNEMYAYYCMPLGAL